MFLVFFVFFLFGCTKTNEMFNNNEYTVNNNEETITLSSDDIKIYDVTQDSFSYYINDNNMTIENISLISESDTIVLDMSGIACDLISNTTYVIKVKYSYIYDGKKIINTIEKNVHTAFVPNYELDVQDDFVIFFFDNADYINYILINDNIHYLKDNSLIINNLNYDETYEYIISYNYQGKEIFINSSLHTKEQPIINVTFVYPSFSEYPVYNDRNVIVQVKKGETITFPDIYPVVKNLGDKCYVFNGFDCDLNTINDDTTVNAIYKNLDKKERYQLKEILPFLNKQINYTKIEIWKSYNGTYEPVKKYYNVPDDDINVIKDAFLNSTVVINDNEEMFGGYNIIIIFKTINGNYSILFSNKKIALFNESYDISEELISLLQSYMIENE